MIPKTAEYIPELKEVYSQAAMNAWSPEELEIYEYWQIRDAGDRYKIQEEFDKGKFEGKLEIARTMKHKGMTAEEVMKITGLSRIELGKAGY
jgi:predicted transposase/invertase (TIGR01784 family)